MRFAYWIAKAINTHSEYVTLIVFPRQQLLYESVSILCYTYITCLAQDIRYSVSNLKPNFCANNDPPVSVVMEHLNMFYTLMSCLLRIVLTLKLRVFRVVTPLDWKKFTDISKDRNVFIFHYIA
jgi:hypothetical protein